MTLILSITLLVSGVLQIILLFKLWGMTNDVRSIRVMMVRHLSGNVNGNEETTPGTIQEGSLVVRLKDEVQMRVIKKEGETFVCRPLGGGYFSSCGKDEIELYNVFYKKETKC